MQDSYRLPEGFTRIAYDADTALYTFRDRNGTLYEGPPRAAYGTLRPIQHAHSSRPLFEGGAHPTTRARGNADTSDADTRRSRSVDLTPSARTFHDILPPQRIAAAPPLTPPQRLHMHPPRANAKPAIRRSTEPPAPGVVRGLVRALTRRAKQPANDDRALLLRPDSAPTDGGRYKAAAQKTSWFKSSKRRRSL